MAAFRIPVQVRIVPVIGRSEEVARRFRRRNRSRWVPEQHVVDKLVAVGTKQLITVSANRARILEVAVLVLLSEVLHALAQRLSLLRRYLNQNLLPLKACDLRVPVRVLPSRITVVLPHLLVLALGAVRVPENTIRFEQWLPVLVDFGFLVLDDRDVGVSMKT